MEASKLEECYVDSLFPPDPELERVIESISGKGMPQISVAKGYGRLLTLLVKASGARHALEIGALGGYSGICLARGLGSDGRLVSLELKQEFADVALDSLTQAGFGGQVDYVVGEALVSLERLEREGRKFDFFFIDADKANYPNYLEFAIRLALPGAIIVGDNTLMHGKSMNPEKQSPSVLAMRLFNERMAQDPRLDGTVLSAYDGLAVARVK